jgi:preprotein translocase subunit SecD
MRHSLRAGVALIVCVALGGALAAEPVRVEVRRAESKPTEGYTEATVRGTANKVYVSNQAGLITKDIAQARLVDTSVELAFTREGQKKLAVLSKQQLNKPVAIIVDGEVIAAPVVRSRLRDKAVISGQFSRPELEKLVKRINER